MKRLLSILIFTACFIFTGSLVFASNGEETFFKANQAYKSGDYNEAARQYLELADKGQTSPDIYYNLGNAYFRLSDYGRAILYYEKAKVGLPRDADLNYNLGYVSDRIKDAIDPPAPPLSSIFFWLGSISPNEVFTFFAVINLIFFGLLIARMFIKQEWTFILLIILIVAWLGTGVSFGVKYYQTAFDDRAVIIAPEASVHAGPDIKDTQLFKLHAGAIVKSEKKEGSWTLIRIPGDKRGWIQDSAIGMIAAD